MQELPKEKRTLALQLALGELQMPEAFGMPSDPRLLFGGLNVEECKVCAVHLPRITTLSPPLTMLLLLPSGLPRAR